MKQFVFEVDGRWLVFSFLVRQVWWKAQAGLLALAAHFSKGGIVAESRNRWAGQPSRVGKQATAPMQLWKLRGERCHLEGAVSAADS